MRVHYKIDFKLNLKEINTIKHGPKFGGLLSTAGIIASVIFAYVVYHSIEIHEWLGAVLYALCSIFSFSIFLDLRGVAIDFENHRIRQYRSFLGVKTGLWEDIENFGEIRIEWDRQHSRSATSLITGSRKSSSSDGYFVLIQGGEGFPPFEIGEYATHKTAQKTAINLAKKLELPLVDQYKKIQIRAKQRRSELDARRKRK